MNHDLAAEIHRRAEQDQAARRRLLETGAADDLLLVDADNTAWLKRVIAEHGWPGITLVGEQGADEAWLLALLYSLRSCRVPRSGGGLGGCREWWLAC
ncbi:hypothetical protein ACFY9A_37665 [Streptomyces rubradiris]|uniref:hypothetical protein n=1 Tax=Streptomyces rubradiris TaxID=285531 RepID=UPI0036ED0A7A